MDDAKLTRKPGPTGAVLDLLFAARVPVLAAIALWAGTGWLAAQDPDPQEPPGVDLQIEGDVIRLGIDESQGLPIFEFIKMAEMLTGRVFIFDQGEVDKFARGRPSHYDDDKPRLDLSNYG